MNDVFKPTGRSTSSTRTSLFKLSQAFRKTNHGQNHLPMWHLVPGMSY